MITVALNGDLFKVPEQEYFWKFKQAKMTNNWIRLTEWIEAVGTPE